MGPIAPKDPIRKRDFYYIMLEKQVSVMPTPDGRGASVIYQNDGRLISSSKIIGNVNDPEIFTLLRTTEGFRKLIFGIGVSMMCEGCSGADFVYQMYGKTDPYNSGTTIRQHISADGVEYLIPLSEVEWSDDDQEPGQIRFELDSADHMPTVNVRFYLNDGYTAPPFEGLDEVDVNSDKYHSMISKSLMSMGNTARLKKVLDRASAGQPITVAFIGGSITQGAGAAPINVNCYAYKTWEGLKSRFGLDDSSLRYVKAGVGGTPSELGMIRYDRDVLSDGLVAPDLVVIEFAVNDDGDETKGDCYESLIRKALNGPGHPAVILIFSVFADDYNLQERLSPIGERYQLPMVSVKNAVTQQFYLSKAEGRVLAKNLYFYDCYHPTNLGHTIMADSLLYLIDKCREQESSDPDIDYAAIEPLKSADFEDVHLIDRSTADTLFLSHKVGSFTETDKELQACEMNKDFNTTPQFPYNWKHAGSGDQPFTCELFCKRLLIVTKDSASPNAAKADIYVDGKYVKTVNPRDIGWTHCNAQIILREDVCAKHQVEVRICKGDENKEFTILGFGIVR